MRTVKKEKKGKEETIKGTLVPWFSKIICSKELFENQVKFYHKQ